MKKRSIAAVILLPFVTFGIYALYWFVKTKGELNEKGASIPTAWLLIIPLVNIWWIWKYYEGADHVTNSKVNGVLMFILDLFVTSLIPMAICQDSYNKLSEAPLDATPAVEPSTTVSVTGTTPEATVASSGNSTPVQSESAPVNSPLAAPEQDNATTEGNPVSVPEGDAKAPENTVV